jgi:hypothetical protein
MPASPRRLPENFKLDYDHEYIIDCPHYTTCTGSPGFDSFAAVMVIRGVRVYPGAKDVVNAFISYGDGFNGTTEQR